MEWTDGLTRLGWALLVPVKQDGRGFLGSGRYKNKVGEIRPGSTGKLNPGGSNEPSKSLGPASVSSPG